MKKKRLLWADSVKGLLMLLVVLGHSIQCTLGAGCENNHLWNAIYSFHMPAFMAMSGFLAYRVGGQWGGQTVISVLYRRFWQLLIPFLLWTLLLAGTNESLFTNLESYFLYPDGGLWFLWVLFFINVFFVLGSSLAERLKVAQEFVILGTCLFLVGLMVVFDVRVFGFQFISYYFLFYSLGYYLNKYNKSLITENVIVLVILFLIWSVLAYFWRMHELPPALQRVPLPGTLLQYAYRFTTAAIAIYIMIAIFPKILHKDNQLNKSLAKIGVYSLGIYTTHMILIGKICSFYSALDFCDSVVIPVTFITSFIVSWIIVWSLSRWELTSKMLLGKV